jgi:hypothetical protein
MPTVTMIMQTWIKQMGVDRLERKDKQPFYNVLVEDGSVRFYGIFSIGLKLRANYWAISVILHNIFILGCYKYRGLYLEPALPPDRCYLLLPKEPSLTHYLQR